MEKATSIINQFDLSKRQINYFVEKVLTEIEEENPLTIISKLKVMEEIVKQLKSKLAHNVSLEADKFPEKTFKLYGITYIKTNRRSYDYSNCQQWVELNEKLKALQELMKTIKSPIADAESGELINPAIYKEKECISVKIPNE